MNGMYIAYCIQSIRSIQVLSLCICMLSSWIRQSKHEFASCWTLTARQTKCQKSNKDAECFSVDDTDYKGSLVSTFYGEFCFFLCVQTSCVVGTAHIISSHLFMKKMRREINRNLALDQQQFIRRVLFIMLPVLIRLHCYATTRSFKWKTHSVPDETSPC